MLPTPTPRSILATLLPHLRVAAAYARQIQSQIVAHPKKDSDNFLAAALSDADLSIQTLIEVAILSTFPNIRFYGEEHERSYNTRYFRAIDLGEMGDYLVTLDPIDGTRFYLDGHQNYQIILSILNADEYEAVIAVTPAQNIYHYAVRGKGCWKGNLETDLDNCDRLMLGDADRAVFFGIAMGAIAPHLEGYRAIDVTQDYSKDAQIPLINGLLTGELSGAITRAGNWIDGAALAFLVQEAGGIVTTLEGTALPPLHTCCNYQRPGLIMASSTTVHQDLLKAVQQLMKQHSAAVP
ncbi:inositol monophosphatase family protein [Leptolyngbya sp. FACHB-711]|uniref:inositol monophosphatase family protein n=1 Tax=unclassified Leptolyngbya TaxID=2650499 RepID=UPI0016871C02|nr:inositol monophosphatase family protein [Leptolyngbya sp. FACHB-711]MBD1851749.1 inositol monophosphatase family protein [Cyanobacteria bacterium FACHB-502]MBD2022870.1 inositol monophosphatase family protein [Leptolyngbya sp. FACHB-711]